MNSSRWLAFGISAVTVGLVVAGTLWPDQTALALSGTRPGALAWSSSPQTAVETLLGKISRMDWQGAYSSLANAGDFSESEFIGDLAGDHGSLRNYATLESFHLTPLEGSAEAAEMRANLRWSTVVGSFSDVRDLRVIRNGDRWQVQWPLAKHPQVPPQVVPVNYLRWDVIYRGPGDDWGTQDVESPHVRIVDMHPVDRGGGAVILGELLNEDVVPAFVTVKATLLAKDGHPLATEDSFDKISHVLLPKQVTPFRIDFHDVRLSQVDSVHLEPTAILIAASADPVIEIEGQQLHPRPEASLSGALVNQSGQVASIAHVLGTFYDSRGQLVWISDQYLDRALFPGTPTQFSIPVPADLVGQVGTYRVVASTYSPDRFQ